MSVGLLVVTLCKRGTREGSCAHTETTSHVLTVYTKRSGGGRAAQAVWLSSSGVRAAAGMLVSYACMHCQRRPRVSMRLPLRDVSCCVVALSNAKSLTSVVPVCPYVAVSAQTVRSRLLRFVPTQTLKHCWTQQYLKMHKHPASKAVPQVIFKARRQSMYRTSFCAMLAALERDSQSADGNDLPQSTGDAAASTAVGDETTEIHRRRSLCLAAFENSMLSSVHNSLPQ